MTEIKSYRNKDLLNRLSEMQRAPYYATACQTLVQAEMAIVALEDELRTALAQQGSMFPKQPSGTSVQ